MRTILFVMLMVSFIILQNSTSVHCASVNGSTYYSYPNITIKNLSVITPVSSNAPLRFFISIANNGDLASGGIILNIRISGPASSEYNYTVNPLSPLQNESFIISENNASIISGEYNVSVIAIYNNSNLSLRSNIYNSSYSVIQPILNTSYGSNVITANYSALQILVHPLNSSVAFQTNMVEIKYSPLSKIDFVNGSIISEMGLENLANSTELINISLGDGYGKLFQLSSNNLYISPNQTIYFQLVLKSLNSQKQVTSYVIPINFNISTSKNATSSINEYINIRVTNSSSQEPVLLNLVLFESATSIIGIRDIKSNTNSTIKNMTLNTFLPVNVTDNLSQITTYGLLSNVSQVDGLYDIRWYIPYLQPGQSLYAYYKISGLESNSFLNQMQNILYIPSPLLSKNLFRVTSLQQSIYANSTADIPISVLYTGVGNQSVSMSLVPFSNITVYNQTRTVNASPNELLNERFAVMVSSPGTFLVDLRLNAGAINATYPMSIVVLPAQQRTTQSSLPARHWELATAFALIILIGGTLAILLSRYRSKKAKAKTPVTAKEDNGEGNDVQ